MVDYIGEMSDDRDPLFLLTELDVEGTWMDPAYMQRVWEAQKVGLWFWAHEAYWDQFAHQTQKSRPHC